MRLKYQVKQFSCGLFLRLIQMFTEFSTYYNTYFYNFYKQLSLIVKIINILHLKLFYKTFICIYFQTRFSNNLLGLILSFTIIYHFTR